MAPDLPCDGDGVCMVCRAKPPEAESVPCRTCATPWHVPCLSAPPETLAAAADWLCPDCSAPSAPTASAGASAGGAVAAGLIASIRAIEADASLTADAPNPTEPNQMVGVSFRVTENPPHCPDNSTFQAQNQWLRSPLVADCAFSNEMLNEHEEQLITLSRDWAHQQYMAKHQQWASHQWGNFFYYRMENISIAFQVHEGAPGLHRQRQVRVQADRDRRRRHRCQARVRVVPHQVRACGQRRQRLQGGRDLQAPPGGYRRRRDRQGQGLHHQDHQNC